VGSRDPNARTNALINMDQAIAKITSQIYLVAYYEFPGIKLRSVSVHVLRPVASGKTALDVLDLVQEGRERKDRASLPLSNSFIGCTMLQDGEKYCPDVRLRPSQFPDCSKFAAFNNTIPEYSSLLCVPLGEPSPEAKRSAGICFDSWVAHAFDREDGRLMDALAQQLARLSSLIIDYRELLSDELNTPAKEAAPPWLPEAGPTY
jgi:hypothetical protein